MLIYINMSGVNNNLPPGYQAPVVNSYPPGAGNPRDAAMIAGQNMNEKQNALNSSVGGSRRKRSHKFKGGANGVPVPTMQMQYKSTNAGGTDPNSQMAGNLSTSMQSRSWAAGDAQATSVPSSPPPVGGSRRRNRKQKGGYNPNWSWGCYSGGKRRRTTRNKSKKNHKRKSRRHSRH
jgi:hypothetical protein